MTRRPRKSRTKAVTRNLRPRVLARRLKHWLDPRSRFYGLDDLDRRLNELLDYEDGYFVELGANDGIRQSNTYYLERHKRWRGVLVEPVPHNYLRCVANRSERNHVFCNACVSFDYDERFVEIAYSDLMSCPIGLDSDVDDPLSHAREGMKYVDSAGPVFTFGAVARPLNELLIEAEAPDRIDLLSLDVEGAELEVLKGIDHDRFRFRYLCIESRDRDKLESYLGARGYALAERLSRHDYLFVDVSRA